MSASSLSTISRARSTAFDVLRLAGKGAHSDDLLAERLAPLVERDAALATELTLGCLRRQNQLDFLIERLSGRPAARLDDEVRVALRLGVYQLRYLDRIPPHAAVGESVELTRRSGKASAAGFVNAVLRKANREPVEWPSPAVEHCLPEWLWAKWVRDFGLTRAQSIALASLVPPETYIHVPFSEAASLAKLDAEPTGVPGCYRLLGRNGRGFRIQDIGSQSIVPLLRIEPKMPFLDLCAAPGNKTRQAVECGAEAVACDLYFSRLHRLAGTPNTSLVVLDAARPLPFATRFERVLVDAPCSGTGTLRRNPEIRWRVQLEDIARYAGRQVAILRNALGVLASGGRLVYSTCSMEREENEEVVERAMAGLDSKYRLEAAHRRIPGEDPGDGFYAAVITLS